VEKHHLSFFVNLLPKCLIKYLRLDMAIWEHSNQISSIGSHCSWNNNKLEIKLNFPSNYVNQKVYVQILNNKDYILREVVFLIHEKAKVIHDEIISKRHSTGCFPQHHKLEQIDNKKYHWEKKWMSYDDLKKLDGKLFWERILESKNSIKDEEKISNYEILLIEISFSYY